MHAEDSVDETNGFEDLDGCLGGNIIDPYYAPTPDASASRTHPWTVSKRTEPLMTGLRSMRYGRI